MIAYLLDYSYVFGYKISKENTNLLIIMDELKSWKPDNNILNTHFDLIYLPLGIFDINPITKKRNVSQKHPILKNEQTFSETLELVKTLKSKQFILSHIEEPDNISLKLAKKLGKYSSKLTNKKVKLAFDTMKINLW